MALQGVAPPGLPSRIIHVEHGFTRTREVRPDESILAKTDVLTERSQDRPTSLGDCHPHE